MSDVPQGPAWWMASDNKWYPPESHPGYQAPPPPPAGASPYSYPGTAPSFPPSYGWSGPVTAGPALANYGERLGGWIIDWIILLAVSVPISLLTHSFHYSHVVNNLNGSYETNFHWGMPGALLSPLIVVVYGTLMCGSARGQTVGMMVAKTRAVKLSTGGPIGYGAALGRALFEELMAALLFFPWVLDILFPLWDAKKQTLHDKVSGTIVVKAERS
jgi:uncharacterized RDD family membrane protein YckC